jgi:Bacterial Ig domain
MIGGFIAPALSMSSTSVAAPDCPSWATLADAPEEGGSSEIELRPQCKYRVSSRFHVRGAGTQITVEGNGATLRGGGVMFEVDAHAVLALDNVTIAHAGDERAIVNRGYLRVAGSTFRGHGSPNGGAIETSRYTRITDSTFVGNVAQKEGGGAIRNRSGGEVIVEDSTFSANESAGPGGAISNQGVLSIRNATLWGNRAQKGAALANSGTAMVTNSIVTGWFGDTLCSGAQPERAPPGNLTDRPDAMCGKDFSRVDGLRLGPLEDNGGLTDTHALLEGSPAIDRGDNAECTTADQRGGERPATKEDPCDVGAFEFLPDPYREVNDPPTALDTTRVVQESSTAIEIDLAELSSDKETADEDLLYELSGPAPREGQASVVGSVLTYDVYTDALGVDSITYRVRDRGALGCNPSPACEGPESATGIVTITIVAAPLPLPVSPSPLPDPTRSPTASPTASPTTSPTPAPLGGPDLSIEDVTLELVPGDSAAGANRVYAAGAGPMVVAAGDSLHVVATVVNSGDEPSTPTSMRVGTPSWEGEPIPIGGVPAGSQLEVDESIDAPPDITGDTKFTVTIDAVPGESDGANNARPDVVAITERDNSTTLVVVVALVAVVVVVVVVVALGPGNVLQNHRPRRPRRRPTQSSLAAALVTTGVTELADHYLGSEPGPPLWDAGTASAKLREQVGDDDLSAPLISTLFWRSIIGTNRFRQALEQLGASRGSLERPEVLIVPHAAGTRYDLVLLDPDFSLSEPSSAEIEAPAEELSKAWKEALFGAGLGRGARVPGTKVPMRSLTGVLKEISGFAKFGLVVAPKPELILTHCPSPAWSVGAEDEEPTSSVGASVKDGNGRTGVTVAEHAVRGHEKVMVNGRLGTVISSDPISDSAFVEVDVDTTDTVRGSKGPLSGLSPRQMEVVEFDGLRSGKTTTRIVGWDPTILTMESYIQNKVVTEPVTMPGDSGAALIDGEGHILGFAFYTTGLNSQPAHSGWIWAESVYRAHGLRSPDKG